MSDIIAATKQLVEHVNNGDLMTALEFFETDLLPYHAKTKSSGDPQLHELIDKLDNTVENEDWNESLEIVDQIGEYINGQ